LTKYINLSQAFDEIMRTYVMPEHPVSRLNKWPDTTPVNEVAEKKMRLTYTATQTNGRYSDKAVQL
jgi:hypothetical protein